MTKETKGSQSSEEVKGELVRQLATILDETDLSEIEVEDGERKIKLSRGGSLVQVAAPAAAPMAAPAGPNKKPPATPLLNAPPNAAFPAVSSLITKSWKTH